MFGFITLCEFSKSVKIDGAGYGRKRALKLAAFAKISVYAKDNVFTQAPHFAITCELNSSNGHCIGAGRMDAEVKRHFPQTLSKLLKYHLFSVGVGPMHYEANALYHAGHDNFYRSCTNIEYLKSEILYGTVAGDEKVDLADLLFDIDATDNHERKEALKAFLAFRLPALLDAFNREMTSLYGAQAYAQVLAQAEAVCIAPEK